MSFFPQSADVAQTSPPRLGLSLSLLKIPVSNIARSVTFYRDVLGFEEQFVVAEYGWAQFQINAVPSALSLALYVPSQGGGDRTMGGSVDFHFSTPNLEALFTQGKEAESQTGADGTRFVEVTDPDGNLLKIVEMPGAA